ncbi:uncharacterized protein FA14DRAFT_19940 [Meira miltonrushii]|uniref:RNA polymerase II subunit B1 CTD phosphatase RPAP2 homolog n=1 Tax=Meira miltonrushii TaxID=1280837 RepID=A0A316VLB0_9BASI|nr:uncharacterized protein FA14DRAFT_19940 [Meira miltonrushii]PWN37858.1 hypothetical protein FA14DRAFT_19940 [Meira miltonrushii]
MNTGQHSYERPKANGTITTMTSRGRMPQAHANLLVQLPPDELKQMAANPRAAIHASNQAGPSKWAMNEQDRNQYLPSSSVQMSDVKLLAESFQERRQKEAKVFMWQHMLIASGSQLERNMLKRALTQVSLPDWLQILQERHLAHKCAYPTCDKKPKKPHLSQRNSALPLDAPRYRISLSRRTMERDERDDAGGQNSFCSNACWRRGEWVSRWVLNNGESTRKIQKEISDEMFGSGLKDHHGLGNEVEEGGKWERVMDEEHWTEIELLEDLEDKGEVDRLSDDEDAAKQTNSPKPDKIMSPVLPTPTSPALSQSENCNDVLSGQATIVARDHAKRRADTKGTAEGFLDLIDSLQIRERATDADTTPTNSIANLPQRIQIDLPIDQDDLTDELGSGTSTNLAGLIKSASRKTQSHLQFDSEGDVSMSDDTTSEDDHADNEEDVLTRAHKRQQTEERKKKRDEEDDLFAQAWQAMSEEKARGTWEEE